MLKLRDIMTTDVVTASPELSLREAMDLLSSRHITGAPVVAGGKVVGVFSASDLLAFLSDFDGSESSLEFRRKARNPLEEVPVAEVMTQIVNHSRLIVRWTRPRHSCMRRTSTVLFGSVGRPRTG